MQKVKRLLSPKLLLINAIRVFGINTKPRTYLTVKVPLKLFMSTALLQLHSAPKPSFPKQIKSLPLQETQITESNKSAAVMSAIKLVLWVWNSVRLWPVGEAGRTGRPFSKPLPIHPPIWLMVMKVRSCWSKGINEFRDSFRRKVIL